MDNIDSLSESDLRDEIYNCLKSSLDGIEEVVIPFHGNEEYGLDLIVFKKDLFGRLKAIGIQIKSGNINQRSQNRISKKIKEIIGQLTIAFGQEVEHTTMGSFSIEEVYLITNGELNTHARNSIKYCHQTMRNIHIIERPLLERFLRGCYPKISEYEET